MKEQGKCVAFVYGGCRGGLNNFETQKKCKETCACGAGETIEIVLYLRLKLVRKNIRGKREGRRKQE